VLTEEEKERVRYHLGYMETSFAASLQFGLPRPVQTIFIVEQAMNLLVNPFAVDRVRRVLWTLDDIEQKLQSALCTLVAEQLGDLKLRGAEPGRTHPDLLEREYIRWARRLADILGVPLYPYSDRFKNRVNTGNISVRG
jgi:hypothetical protein